MDDTRTVYTHRDYYLAELHRKDLDEDPFAQFSHWFDDSIQAKEIDPETMTLATASKAGVPSSRTVLLKGWSHLGFLFFTNYKSRKARDLMENPQASIVFLWKKLERQVIIEGHAEKTSKEISQTYFNHRSLESRLSAIASPQGEEVGSREEIEQKVKELEKQYSSGNIPVPDFWGGFRLIPQEFEFWQGRPNRLHDRFRYKRQENGWKIVRIAP